MVHEERNFGGKMRKPGFQGSPACVPFWDPRDLGPKSQGALPVVRMVLVSDQHMMTLGDAVAREARLHGG